MENYTKSVVNTNLLLMKVWVDYWTGFTKGYMEQCEKNLKTPFKDWTLDK